MSPDRLLTTSAARPPSSGWRYQDLDVRPPGGVLVLTTIAAQDLSLLLRPILAVDHHGRATRDHGPSSAPTVPPAPTSATGSWPPTAGPGDGPGPGDLTRPPGVRVPRPGPALGTTLPARPGVAGACHTSTRKGR